MVNYEKLTNSLITSVGLRQTIDNNYPKLNDNLVFEAGKVLIKHPLLTIENIFETAKQFDDINIPDYDPVKVYNNDDPYSNRVTGSDGKFYEYINDVPSSGNDPVNDANNTFWVLVTLESLYLEDIFKNAAYEIISEIMRNKGNRYETKSLLQYEKMFDGIGNPRDQIISTGSLVGFEIIPKRNEGINVLINQIGTHFAGNTDVNFMLFHSSRIDPIKTFTLSHVGQNFQWHKVKDQDLSLPYVSDDLDAGGSFYLMYDQDDVVNQAINKNYDYFRSCSYCSRYDNDARISRKDFYFIRAVEIMANDRIQVGGVEKMFDTNNIKETNQKTYGLNLSVSALCDVTDLIIDQKDIIAKTLATKIIVDLLHEISLSTRINSIEERVKKEARFALQSKVTGGEGIMSRYEKEIDALDFDLSNLNSRCLPKKMRGRGIKTSSNNLYRS